MNPTMYPVTFIRPDPNKNRTTIRHRERLSLYRPLMATDSLAAEAVIVASLSPRRRLVGEESNCCDG